MHISRWAPLKHAGFTIVEITVVIVIIGLLATIGLVSYRGIQQRAITTTLKSDLTNAAKQMEVARGTTRAYPDFLPADMKASKGVGLQLVGISSAYSGLSPVQNSELFYQICTQLITEGYGNGASVSGQPAQYITSCNVYNNNYIHINGWHSQSAYVPIGQNTIRDWYNTTVSYDAWWSDKKTVLLNFADTLSARFVAKGGTFPITSFWDNSNTPVPRQSLPAPTTIFDPSTFCVQAYHVNYPDAYWHISAGETKPNTGACPTT